MPPPFLFRSNLNGVLKPSTLNCETGKESSNFVSVTIKISKSCISIGLISLDISQSDILEWPKQFCVLGEKVSKILKDNKNEDSCIKDSKGLWEPENISRAKDSHCVKYRNFT